MCEALAHCNGQDALHAAFLAALGEPNCVAFIAYDSAGTVVARNYALVAQAPSESTTILLR